MILTQSYTFTRPANTTQYSSGDLVANSTTAGSVVPIKFNIGHGGGYITSINLSKSDGADVTGADFLIRFFTSSPTVANGDNGAISHDVAGIIGTLNFATMVSATDDAWAALKVGDSPYLTGLYVPPVVFALIETDGTYTPASEETFTVAITYNTLL